MGVFIIFLRIYSLKSKRMNTQRCKENAYFCIFRPGYFGRKFTSVVPQQKETVHKILKIPRL